MTFESLKQLVLFIIVCSISFSLGLSIFYVLKNKLINHFGSNELKEANKELNSIIDK